MLAAQRGVETDADDPTDLRKILRDENGVTRSGSGSEIAVPLRSPATARVLDLALLSERIRVASPFMGAEVSSTEMALEMLQGEPKVRYRRDVPRPQDPPTA